MADDDKKADDEGPQVAPISYAYLFDLISREENARYRWLQEFEPVYGPLMQTRKDREAFIRLGTLVGLFETFEAEFIEVIKRGKARRK